MRGKSLRFLGSALLYMSFLCLVVVFFFEKTRPESGTDWLTLGKTLGVGLTTVFLMGLGGVKSLKRGKQLDAESAQALLAQDTRPPVVYLRSFQDDSVAGKGSLSELLVPSLGGGLLMVAMLAALDRRGGIVSEEEQLAEALQDLGPFVAVGKPGEKLPQLGASRMYLQDSEWRDKVRGLMSRAGLVVLRAGNTDGLWWEVQTAARIVRPEKIIFLLPYKPEQYDLFRSRAEKYLSCRLPDYPSGKRNVAAGSIREILYFEPDWRPHLLELKEFDRSTNQFVITFVPTFAPTKPWVRTFKTTLEPVFKQLGVESLAVKRPKRSLLKVLLLVVLSPIVAIIAGLLAVCFYLVLKIVAGTDHASTVTPPDPAVDSAAVRTSPAVAWQPWSVVGLQISVPGFDKPEQHQVPMKQPTELKQSIEAFEAYQIASGSVLVAALRIIYKSEIQPSPDGALQESLNVMAAQPGITGLQSSSSRALVSGKPAARAVVLFTADGRHQRLESLVFISGRTMWQVTAAVPDSEQASVTLERILGSVSPE
jgi:hypothetical protein